MNGNIRGGAEFAGFYLGKIVFAFVMIALIIYLLQIINMDGTVVSFFSLLWTMVTLMTPFVLLTALAYAAGYCPPGTRDRLYIRLMMSAFVIFNIFFVSHAVDYGIDFITIDDTIGGYMRDIDIHLNLVGICTLLIVFPITSAIDSVLEYVQERGTIQPDTE